MSDDDRRYRGILTPSDRAALRGDADLDPEAARHARYRIRERVKRAFDDLSFLFSRLPDRDRELIFEEVVREPGTGEPLHELLEFVFLGVYDTADEFRDPYGNGFDGPIDALETLVANGVSGAEWERGQDADVAVEIGVDRWAPDPDAAIDRIESGYGCVDDLAYLVKWCDDTRFLERTAETGEPLRLVLGPASIVGSQCLIELTPEEAEEWLASSERGGSSLTDDERS